jgi:hypothetical protein
MGAVISTPLCALDGDTSPHTLTIQYSSGTHTVTTHDGSIFLQQSVSGTALNEARGTEVRHNHLRAHAAYLRYFVVLCDLMLLQTLAAVLIPLQLLLPLLYV